MCRPIWSRWFETKAGGSASRGARGGGLTSIICVLYFYNGRASKSPPRFSKYFPIIFCALVFLVPSPFWAIYPMHHHCVYTQDPQFSQVIGWLQSHSIPLEPHINRTRFWIPPGPAYTEFLLRFSHCSPPVPPDQDLALGHKKSPNGLELG